MKLSRQLLLAAAVGVNLIALGARPAYAQAPAPDTRAPSAIEVALAEHSCGAEVSGTIGDAHYKCVNAAVDELRARFGYDLGLLSKAERQSIEKHCGAFRTAEGRDAYVSCVNSALAPLRVGKEASVDAPGPGASTGTAASTDAPPAPSPVKWWWWLAGALGVCGVCASGAFIVIRRVSASHHRCRTCGARVTSAGDLCADCRKKAAEALRHAAAERASRERAEQDERSRREEDVRERERVEVEARTHREEQERQHAIEREARRREEEAREKASVAAAAAAPDVGDPETFDPCAVLGVSHDAGANAIAEAYEAARSKYDPDIVAHLGDEVQAHFRMKAEAVERAYKVLTTGCNISA